MKSKKILKFYFNVDDLERAVNSLISAIAIKSYDVFNDGEKTAERILKLVEVKKELGRLWNYLDGVVSGLDERDAATLKNYASMRGGISALPKGEQREVRRAVVKFVRRARNVERFAEGLAAAREFYCLY